jgi:hypothetical protein
MGGAGIAKGGAKLGAKLAQRGGIKLGSSKTIMITAKANPSEKSIGIIYKGKRVFDLGKAQIKPGRPKQLHIRFGNGPHRNIFGCRIK